MMVSLLRDALQKKSMQAIALKDVGKWVALAFSTPVKYLNTNSKIAGDKLT
jgi:hypothetical protein